MPPTAALAAALFCVSTAGAANGTASKPDAHRLPTPQPAAADAIDRFAVAILATADHRGLPFAVVDKQTARLRIYAAEGRQLGDTAVLIGSAAGDRSRPGVGDRTRSGRLQGDDRVTPSGRFDSEPGRNLTGEAIVWLDYDAALAIHRLRSGPAERTRAQRLASPHAADRRASAGCVVVPVAFYESVVAPVLGRQRGVVYVLPEDSTADALGWALIERAE